MNEKQVIDFPEFDYIVTIYGKTKYPNKETLLNELVHGICINGVIAGTHKKIDYDVKPASKIIPVNGNVLPIKN